MSNSFLAFKFCAVRPHVLKSITQSTIYFSAPPALNDPTDCQINLTEALGRAIGSTTGKRHALLTKVNHHELTARIERDVPTFGVWSFSIDLTNALLWSHYGDMHRGICLLYEIPYDFVTTNEILGLSPVNYGDNPLTEWLVTDLDDSLSVENACIETMKRLLAVKSAAWAYEEEARLLRRWPGVVSVPREFLAQICFGLRTSNQDKAAVRHACAEYSHIHLTEMMRDKDSDTRLTLQGP